MRGIIYSAITCMMLIGILLISSCTSYELKPVTEEQIAAEEQQIEQGLEEIEEMQELEQEAEEINIEFEPEEKEVVEYEEPVAEEPVTIEEPVPEGVDPEILAIQKAGKSTDDINYFYREMGGDFGDSEVFIRGSKMRLKYSSLRGDEKESYTQIFVDFSAKTAKAVCADGIKCSMNFNQPFDIKFDRFLNFKTPMFWAQQVPNNAKFTGTTKFMSRNVYNLEYGAVKMQVYDFYKLPAKVEAGGKFYSFEIFKTTCPEKDVTLGGVLI
ncbi:hypothetical protein KY340_02170 [Candidatus Woesearchaeota archaeon]|nr:hypothetical protein [Candidatus Woesearchaeota archaeon]